LIGGLSGERQRWAATASSLEDSLTCLEGDALLASAAVTYLGPLKADARITCTEEWHLLLQNESISWTENEDITEILTADLDMDAWHIGGLQRDIASVQSAVIAWHTLRPCICLDPEHQAKAWIKTAEHKLHVTRDWDDELATKCKEENAALLVENVESPDSLLEVMKNFPLKRLVVTVYVFEFKQEPSLFSAIMDLGYI
jgi:dynein heavy chain, axonemal